MSAYHRTAQAQARRKRDRATVTLPAQCARCGGIIQPGDKWDLGHSVDVVAGGQDSATYPEHQSCNRRAGARIGGQITQLRRRRPETPNW